MLNRISEIIQQIFGPPREKQSVKERCKRDIEKFKKLEDKVRRLAKEVGVNFP